MIPPSSRLCMLLAVAATMLVCTHSTTDSDFDRDAGHAKDRRDLQLTSDVALRLAAAALRGLAHYPLEPLINQTTTELDDETVATEAVWREAARKLAKDLLRPGRLFSLFAQPGIVAAVAKELRGLRCIDDAANSSSVLPQKITTIMIQRDVPPCRPDVRLNRGSGSQSKLGFESLSSSPNHTGVLERNSVTVGGPADQCISDDDCPPAHYCATGIAGNSCDKCSDFHLGGGQCDDVSGSCCSAAFLKQCPDNPAGCGQPCQSDGECSMNEYCDAEYGCYRCSAVSSQACYDVSGNCCTDEFLRQCPDNPADCCHADSDCPRDQFCAHDFQRPYNFCFDCSVNDPVVCHDVSGDCCSSMFLEQCPDNPANCCESDGDCPSPEICLSTGRCGCHADEDCPVGGFCAVGAGTGNFCYACSLVTPERCYDISGDCCSPTFLEKCPDDPAGCGPLCEDDSDCSKGQICNVGHCGTPSQDKDTLLATFTPGPGIASVAWEKLRGWNDATDPCLSPGWEGVVCIGGRVHQVVLGNDPQHASDLGFQLGPAVARLGSLSDLVVTGTAMSGTIPSELCQLSTLEQLSLSMNPLLSGSIPQQLGQLSSLVWLNLFNNPLLTGNIPDEIGQLSALRTLTLANNPLVSGTLPVRLGEARNLVELGIYDMPLLSGTIPAALGDLSTLLQFDLNSNPLLSGTISPELGQLSKVQYVLVFSNPLLSGTIPQQLGHGLSTLSTLDVYSNPSLSGTIPTSFGELFALQSLKMVSNPSLSGSIPSQLGALPSLKFLDLYSNPLLSGSLPNFAGTQLVSLNVGSCSLSRLPTSLPASIDHLYLNRNPIKANTVEVSTLLGSMNVSTLHVLDIGFSWPVALESHVVAGKTTSHGTRVKNPSPCRLATPCEFVLHMYDEDDRPATVGGLVFNLTLSFNGSRVAMSDNHDGTFTAAIPDGWIRSKGGPHLFHFEHNGVEFRPMATAHNTIGLPDAADDCHNPPIDGDLCTGLRTVKFLPRDCPPGSHTAPDKATGASCICQPGFVQDVSNTTSVSCHRRCGADESVSDDGGSCKCNGRNYDTDLHGILLCSTGGWTAHPDSFVFKDAQATRMKGGKCVPCPAECTRCEDGVPTLREGWRLNSTSNGELRAQLARGKEGRTQWIFSCPYSRTDCPAINVELASRTYDDNAISCLGQHNGPLCATCVQGYSRRGSNDNSCEPCSEISDYIASQFGVAEAAFVGIALCSMGATIAILYGLRKQIKQLKSEIKTNQRILLGSAQVLALLPSTLELVFPPQAKPAFSFTAIAVADLRSVVRFECWGWTWYDKWIANVIGLPALAVMPIAIYWLISHLSSRHVDSDTRSAVNAEVRQSCARALAFVAMLLYPQVSSTIFSALRCEALGEGATWLEVDFSVSCLDERYSRYRAAAVVMVCVVPIGFPLGLLVVLLRSRIQSRDSWEAEIQCTDGEHTSSLAIYHYARVQDRFGFACGDYRPSCFWFEPVDLLRKLALSGLLQFVHRGTAAQCFCGSAIAFVSFGTQQWLRPYKQPGSNVLKALVDTQLFLTFLISFILRVLPQITSSEPFGAEVYGWILLSSMILLVTSAIVITLAQIYRRRRFQAGLLGSGVDLASVGSVSLVRLSGSDDGRSSSEFPVSAMFRRMPVTSSSTRDNQSAGASGFAAE